ncbi:MAG: hypothetical protein AB7T14_04330 [Candidatus Methylacidiphilaceae bacterium]
MLTSAAVTARPIMPIRPVASPPDSSRLLGLAAGFCVSRVLFGCSPVRADGRTV